jgi:hypothetical protein
MTTLGPNAGATMPARLSLTKAQRDALLLLPDTEEAFDVAVSGDSQTTVYAAKTRKTQNQGVAPREILLPNRR